MQVLTIMDKINLVESIDLNGDHDLNFCNGCVYSKHHCTPFPLNGGSPLKEILGLMHIDLCHPIATTFHGRAKYILTFIDDFLKKTFLYTMKTKFGVFNNLKVFKALVENQILKCIKVIKCDGTWEYNF